MPATPLTLLSVTRTADNRHTMPHAVFASELGANTGHVVRYRALAAALLADGHRVTFIARDAARARQVLAPLPVEVEAGYTDFTPTSRRRRGALTLAGIFWNCGFHAAEVIAARVSCWQAALARLAPAVAICDHAPSALLAARLLGIPAFAAGSGFMIPPAEVPLPALRGWLADDPAARHAEEQALLAPLNKALASLGGAPLPALAVLYAAPSALLMCFPELDHYPRRRAAEYLGTFDSADYPGQPAWPPGDGPLAFGYLNADVLVPEIVAAVAAAGARLCLVMSNRTAPAPFAHPAATFMPAPVAMEAVAPVIDLAVTNGGFNTVTRLLRAGVPQLIVSHDAEKYMLGRRVEQLGAGLLLPRARSADLPAAARALLHSRDYRRAAARFAAAHAEETLADQIARMRQRIGLPARAGTP